MLTQVDSYGNMDIWKKILSLQLKQILHMVGDMYIPCSTTWSGAEG